MGYGAILWGSWQWLGSKVQVVLLYLTDDEFKEELKRQFHTKDKGFLVQRLLKKIQENRSIQEYIQEFSSLQLKLLGMTLIKLLFNFLDGLRLWAQEDLREQKVQDLASTIGENHW